MNLTKLKHIVAVDRAGSITGAAQALSITQSTVTKSVAEVEREIGYALFERHARGVSTTADGRDFINRAERIVSDMDQLIDDAQSRRQSIEKVLRIGIAPPSLEGLLNRAVLSVVQKNPDLRIHLTAVSVERGIGFLRKGDLDVLVAPHLPLSREPDFKCETLSDMRARFFTRKAHPLSGRSDLNLNDFGEYPIISTDRINPYTDLLPELTRSGDNGMSGHFHVIEYFPMVAEIVAATDCVAIVGEGYASARAFQKRFWVADVDLLEPMPVSCAYRARWLPTSSMLSFLNAVKTHPPASLAASTG